jgi:hypothetical protein
MMGVEEDWKSERKGGRAAKTGLFKSGALEGNLKRQN